MNYLKDTEIDIKRVQKKIKENFKNTRNDRPKKFFLSAEYIPQKYIYDYMKEEHQYTLNIIKEIKDNCLIFLYDDIEAKNYGWYSKKPIQEKLIEWANKAYPKIEFEEIVMKRFL